MKPLQLLSIPSPQSSGRREFTLGLLSSQSPPVQHTPPSTVGTPASQVGELQRPSGSPSWSKSLGALMQVCDGSSQRSTVQAESSLHVLGVPRTQPRRVSQRSRPLQNTWSSQTVSSVTLTQRLPSVQKSRVQAIPSSHCALRVQYCPSASGSGSVSVTGRTSRREPSVTVASKTAASAKPMGESVHPTVVTVKARARDTQDTQDTQDTAEVWCETSLARSRYIRWRRSGEPWSIGTLVFLGCSCG